MSNIRKAEPAPDYPPEEGCYLRGNDYSPVAVLVILKWRREETPADIENLVRVAAENGAALAGTLQTENIGLEKVICNVVANPNIRYLVVFGPESPGHLVGETVVALAKNGVDERQRITGTHAITPYLFNIPREKIERFRKQVTVLDLVNEGSPDTLREVVAACYQETPTKFREWMLFDPGAFPVPPLKGGITWRVTNPTIAPKNEKERVEAEKLRELMERVKKAQQRKEAARRGNSETQV